MQIHDVKNMHCTFKEIKTKIWICIFKLQKFYLFIKCAPNVFQIIMGAL
jgi:hypothetical protein